MRNRNPRTCLVASTLAAACAALALPPASSAQVSARVLKSLSAPDKRRDPDRHAGVPGRRADRRDRREGPRRAGLHPRPERLQQQLPRRVGLRDRARASTASAPRTTRSSSSPS